MSKVVRLCETGVGVNAGMDGHAEGWPVVRPMDSRCGRHTVHCQTAAVWAASQLLRPSCVTWSPLLSCRCSIASSLCCR